MATQRRLSRPPLKEAVIDLRFGEDLDSDVLARIEKIEVEGFLSRRPIRLGQFTFDLPENAKASAAITDARIGVRLENSDASRIIQFRLNGFTYSALRGYTSWEEFSAEARTCWEILRAAVQPASISRIAVRYINLIELPLADLSFDDYFTTAPQIPSELPQGLSGFLQRFVIPFPEEGLIAIVTQALEQPNPSGIPLVLDIDVFSERPISADSPELWPAFASLRSVKNRIFFASVTDLALKKYE